MGEGRGGEGKDWWVPIPRPLKPMPSFPPPPLGSARPLLPPLLPLSFPFIPKSPAPFALLNIYLICLSLSEQNAKHWPIGHKRTNALNNPWPIASHQSQLLVVVDGKKGKKEEQKRRDKQRTRRNNWWKRDTAEEVKQLANNCNWWTDRHNWRQLDGRTTTQ